MPSRPNLSARSSVAIVATLVMLSYYPTVLKLVQNWTSNDMYSYAFVVPFISAFLVWVKRNELRETPISPSLGIGAVVLAIGLLMLVVGRASGASLVEELSLIVTICGLTLLFFGTRVLGAVLFPIGYLLAMIPFWEYLTDRLHPPFQMYSATVGVALVRTVGVPAFREGVLIHLPNINLEVAEACSGINYLVSVFCIGIPMTYLFVRSWFKRIVIVLAAIGIALVSNAVRVAVVSMFAYHGILGADGDIHGPFALFRSLLISGVGFLVIFGLVFRLADKDGLFYSLWAQQEGEDQKPRSPWALRPASVLLAAIMLGGVVGFALLHQVAAVPLAQDLRAVPVEIGRWAFRRAGSSFGAVEDLRFDDRLSRGYTAPDGAELNLFLGYFRTQAQGRELVGYTVRSALGAGTRVAYPLRSGEPQVVNDFLTGSGTETFHVTYWYVLDGRVVSTEYQARLRTAWNSLVHGRSNGGIVIVKSRARQGESIEIARVRTRAFLETFVAMSKDYFPG